MSETPKTVERSLESLVGEAADEFLRRQRDGERPDVEEYAARYPEAAELLRPVLASLRLLDLSQSGPEDPAEPGAGEARGTLGDFRLIREVGRGGMGVVYEAEQLSLSRRVALKVLPLAGTLDERHLRRFKNEALAAAHLDHPNIVDVLGVGSERGVHYYAMRFIEGQTLADVIRALRDDRAGTASADQDATRAYTPPAVEAPTPPAAATLDQGLLSTKGSTRAVAFFRAAAQLGVQVAEALDHAHQQGIIHRDIKPSNLLVDGRGKVWVTDFGLAQVQSDVKLTQTGDLVGTLRYMSPEQALARRGLVDHRTDVYSLGATLYELLTLRPPFAGNDRQEVLRQIAFEEPPPPRRLNSAIPQELETIVIKALEKNPQDRYATAQELANDLRCWLEDRPIRARQPSWRQRAAKWARRHKPVVWAALVLLLLTTMLGSSAAVWFWQQQAAEEQEVERVLKDARDLQEQGKKPEALAAAQRAHSLLPGRTINQDLQQRVRQRWADLEMDARLEEIRGDWKNEDIALKSDAAYAQAFRQYGIDVAALPAAEAARRIQRTSIRVELAAALFDWAWNRGHLRGTEDWTRKELLALASAADPDDWRDRVRKALERWDAGSLKELAASEQTLDLPPSTLVLLGVALKQTGAVEEAAALLRQAQQQYPGDFWVNHELAWVLYGEGRPAHGEDVVRFCTAALALRPRSARAQSNLGIALAQQGRLDEAIVHYRAAIRLDKEFAGPHYNLGNALRTKGRLDEAIAEYQEAIRLEKDYGPAHSNLGIALAKKGRLDEAIAELQEGLRLNKDDAKAHNNLGSALRGRGRLDEAITEFQEAIRIKKDYAMAHYNLALALGDKGRLDEAIAAGREAVRLNKDYALARNNLGNALKAKGQLDEAIQEWREAIRINKDFPAPYCSLGLTLLEMGQFQEAVAALRRGHELGSRDPRWPLPSARWLQQAELMAQLEDRLPDFLRGRRQAADATERLALAQLCQMPERALYAAATRWYAEAIVAEPRLFADPQTILRYNAACAAALAGCGQGKDADTQDEKERARLRRQALDWLGADLAAWGKRLEKEPARFRAVVRKQLEHWQQDTDLAGVRGPEALARLPEAERQAWRKLWAEVADTLARAQENAVPPKKSDTK